MLKNPYKWSPRNNIVNRQELRRELERYNRQPFLDLLAEFMQCRPDPITIALWAREHPDKWMNAIATCAKAAGFADQLEVNSNNTHLHVHELSDAQLLQRLEELRIQHSSDTIQSQTVQSADIKKPAGVRNSNAQLIEHKSSSENDQS